MYDCVLWPGVEGATVEERVAGTGVRVIVGVGTGAEGAELEGSVPTDAAAGIVDGGVVVEDTCVVDVAAPRANEPARLVPPARCTGPPEVSGPMITTTTMAAKTPTETSAVLRADMAPTNTPRRRAVASHPASTHRVPMSPLHQFAVGEKLTVAGSDQVSRG